MTIYIYNVFTTEAGDGVLLCRGVKTLRAYKIS